MNHLTRIFTTAQRLQSSRSFLRDLKGLEKTREGLEFAKAIGDAACDGATAQDVAEQVIKAMAGNEAAALNLLESVQELAKAHVERHSRTLSNGKTVDVKAYETARQASMKATTMAHGATFHAMRSKTPEAHENAAASHEDAAKQHEGAHGLHPEDSPEVGKDHANLKGQHQMAADYHRNEAASLRNGHSYGVAKEKADYATQAAKGAVTTHEGAVLHRGAAEAHKKAHAYRDDAGHGEQAEIHRRTAEAFEAGNAAMNSPVPGKAPHDAKAASITAMSYTQKAHEMGTPAAHSLAAKAHGDAAEKHMQLHGEHESDEDGHHGQIASKHIDLHAYHASKANDRVEVAKGEGAMCATGGGTDIATKEGGTALAVEGGLRGDKETKDEEDLDGKGMTGEIGKAHVGAYARTQGGAMVQVKAYDTVGQAAKVPNKTHAHALELNSPHQEHALRAMRAGDRAKEATYKASSEGHSKAAEYHNDAAYMHRQIGTAKGDSLSAEHEGLAAQHRTHAANAEDTEANHAKAREAHIQAAEEHLRAANSHRKEKPTGSPEEVEHHGQKILHAKAAEYHREREELAHQNEIPASVHSMAAMEKAAKLHGNNPGRKASEEAHESTKRAGDRDTARSHSQAFNAHTKAAKAHQDYVKENLHDHTPEVLEGHLSIAKHHADAAHAHLREMQAKKDAAIPGVEGAEVGKAHIEAHTREVGGKVVQVQAYDTHHAAAQHLASAAHALTAKSATLNPQGHAEAAAAHMKAGEAHKETAKYAPEEWMRKGHEQQAELHGHYAKAHDAKAKAGAAHADTGVDQPQHTPESIKELENHEDYEGHGYHGHSGRDSATDLALAHAADRAKIGKHELAAHLLSSSGRHMMDDMPRENKNEEGETIGKEDLQKKHEGRIAHFQRWITDPKKAKEYGIKDYTKDLKEREEKGAKVAAPAKS